MSRKVRDRLGRSSGGHRGRSRVGPDRVAEVGATFPRKKFFYLGNEKSSLFYRETQNSLKILII